MQAKIFQQEQGCDTEYKDLITETIYATIYPDQGWYIFKHGYGTTWYNSFYNTIQKGSDTFNPSNGFHLFRLATLEEIYKLQDTALTNYEIY